MRLDLLAALALLVAAASPARAFDCEKATTPTEKAICADPAARAADAAMAEAFSASMALESPAAKPMLAAAQVRWLRDRDFACDAFKSAELSACLARESARRRAFLAAEPEAGPGAPGRLAPLFRIKQGSKRNAGIDLQLLKYPSPATPAERAFNAAVDKLVGPLDEPQADDPSPGQYEYDRTMRLTYASPRLISAHLDGFNDTGGAHPITFSGNVNIDVNEGREARFSDFIDAAGAKAVFALCLKEIVAEKRRRMGADAPLGPDDLKELAKTIAEATGQLTSWSFGADRATVTYDPYAVGAYVEGAYACEIPYMTLKPLAKTSFPFPEE